MKDKTLNWIKCSIAFALFALLFILVCGPKACELNDKMVEEKRESCRKAENELANRVANNVIYVKDKRTGICFAIYNAYNSARGYMAAVDCKKAGL